MRKFLTYLIVLFISTSFVFAGEPGSTGAVELKIPVSPRAIGMGEAFGAVANDASAIYWNPAGLRQMGGKHITAQYVSFLETVKYNYIAAAMPVGINKKIGVGVSAKLLSTGTEIALDSSGNNIGELTAGFTEFDLAGAYKLNYALDVGLTTKFLSKKLFNKSASTFAVDLGFMYQTGIKRLKAGLVLQNLGPGMKFDQAADKLPFNIKVATAYQVNKDFTAAYDLNFPNDNKPVASIGGEYWYRDKLVGRFGYRYQGALNLNDVGVGGKVGLFLGAGVKFPALNNYFGIDYAWSTYGFLGTLHRIGLNVYI